MIDIQLSKEGIRRMMFAGTVSDIATEMAFSVCAVYKNLHDKDADAAEDFKNHLMLILEIPSTWETLLDDDDESYETEESEEAPKEENDPVVIDFMEELRKREGRT